MQTSSDSYLDFLILLSYLAPLSLVIFVTSAFLLLKAKLYIEAFLLGVPPLTSVLVSFIATSTTDYLVPLVDLDGEVYGHASPTNIWTTLDYPVELASYFLISIGVLVLAAKVHGSAKGNPDSLGT